MPGLGIVDVTVIRCDIEIANGHKPFMRLHLLLDVFGDLAQPEQLVCEFIAADFLSVHHVKIQYAHTIDGYTQYASLRVVQFRHIGFHLAGFVPADDGHTVVGFLTGVHDVITGSFDIIARKVLIGQLGFLQTQDIRFSGHQPVEHLRQTDLEGIDVPGGYFHIDKLSPQRSQSTQRIILDYHKLTRLIPSISLRLAKFIINALLNPLAFKYESVCEINNSLKWFVAFSSTIISFSTIISIRCPFIQIPL